MLSAIDAPTMHAKIMPLKPRKTRTMTKICTALAGGNTIIGSEIKADLVKFARIIKTGNIKLEQ